MDTLKEYRNADYDTDVCFDKTTSWPEGLQEKDQFVPNLPRPVRRTNSSDDIQRYKDHFLLGQRNMGKWFQWKHYLKLLIDDLRQFDTRDLVTETLVERLASPQESEISHYVTASETEIGEKPRPIHNKLIKRQSIFDVESIGDTESVSSMAAVSMKTLSSMDAISICSSVPLSPQKNLLKKFCGEIRQLASKTYKTVEKMSAKSKYCSACGDNMGNMKKAHKECPKLLRNVVDRKKPMTADVLNGDTDIRELSSEVRQLASEASKKVEKIFVKSIYCSACGDYTVLINVNNEYLHLLLNGNDYKKPTTPSMLKNTNLVRKLSISLTSMTSIDSGDSAFNPQSTKQMSTSHKKTVFQKRMWPFTKENAQQIKD